MEYDFADPTAGLRDHDVDAAVVRPPLGLAGIATLELITEPRVACLPAGRRLAHRETVAVSDLLTEPIIAAPSSPGPWRDYWLLADYKTGPAPVVGEAARRWTAHGGPRRGHQHHLGGRVLLYADIYYFWSSVVLCRPGLVAGEFGRRARPGGYRPGCSRTRRRASTDPEQRQPEPASALYGEIVRPGRIVRRALRHCLNGSMSLGFSQAKQAATSGGART